MWLFLAALSGWPSLLDGKLVKVREIDLERPPGGLPGFPVFALRFSPDGRKLAVIADVYETRGGRKSRLLVIDMEHPSAGIRQFEVEFGILDGVGNLNFGWTPSGEIVYAVGTVIHLESGTTCQVPNQTVFIDNHVAMSWRGVFYDGNCEKRGTWDVRESWLITDVSTDRGLLSVAKESVRPSEQEGLIVDPLARKVVRRWPWKDTPGGGWEFADRGKAVCQGGAGFNVHRMPAVCRSVDTGKEIAETRRNGDLPIATAGRATRIVVSDNRRKKIPFDYEYHTTLAGRYVWDFGTRQELARWYPESQTYPNVLSPPKQITEPFRFALSPDGQYVAEGGNGVIRLYRIEP
jgi:hypothetical protein